MNHESRLLRSTNAERRIALMRRDSGVNRVPWSTGRRIPPIRGREASRRPASRWHGARRRRPLPRAARGDPRRHHRDDDRLRDRRAVRDAARAPQGGEKPSSKSVRNKCTGIARESSSGSDAATRSPPLNRSDPATGVTSKVSLAARHPCRRSGSPPNPLDSTAVANLDGP